MTIFEWKDDIGGIMRYGIPEFRLPKSILDRYRQRLLDMGIKIRPNTTIGAVLKIDDLLRDGYASIFVGTGVWKARNLGIHGECLGNVQFGIDYLANPSGYELGENVAIIGMGNAAMDVARTALRNGARHVTLYARGTRAAALILTSNFVPAQVLMSAVRRQPCLNPSKENEASRDSVHRFRESKDCLESRPC